MSILRTRPLALRSQTESGKEEVHGLCVIPPTVDTAASIQYFLTPGACRRFSARVGLNPELADMPFLSASFSVMGDDRELAAVEVKAGDPPVFIEAQLGRTRFFTLLMAYSGNLSPTERDRIKASTSAPHGVWAEPVLN